MRTPMNTHGIGWKLLGVSRLCDFVQATIEWRIAHREIKTEIRVFKVQIGGWEDHVRDTGVLTEVAEDGAVRCAPRDFNPALQSINTDVRFCMEQ